MAPRALDERGFEILTIHGLSWLAAGNAVGLLLATLLLFPALGDLLAPLSFGRWAPVHLDLQLYGWCGVTLIGLLFRVFMPSASAGRLPELAVGLWSGALLFAVVSWLTGHAGSKPFLEFAGAARVGLASASVALWVLLAIGFHRQRRERAGDREPRSIAWAKGALLSGLAALPPTLYWACGAGVYPPINPDSGGATGGSLMGSTLAVIAIVVLCPLVVGLAPRGGARDLALPAALFAAQALWFGLLDHANHSHHEWLQVASLASLTLWLPVLGRYLRCFAWPAAARPWLFAFCAWGTVLLVSGTLLFLPGALERFKFTSALVGHAHLAMAGMVTSFNVLALVAVNPRPAWAALFADHRAFAMWQGGCLLFVVAMTALGAIEGGAGVPLTRAVSLAGALYGARWLAGSAMLWASTRWLTTALRTWSAA